MPVLTGIDIINAWIFIAAGWILIFLWLYARYFFFCQPPPPAKPSGSPWYKTWKGFQ